MKYLWRKLKEPGRIYQILLVLLVLFGFYRWFLPGIVSYGDWVIPHPGRTTELLQWPHIFRESWGLGSLLGIFFHRTPLEHTLALLNAVGFSYDWLSIIFYYLIAPVLAIIGMWKLVIRITKSYRAAFIAAVIYTFSSYILLLLQGGHALSMVTYALLPFLLYYFDRLLEKPSLKLAALVALFYTLQNLYDPRFAYLSIIIIIFWTIGRYRKNYDLKAIGKYAFVAVVFFVLASLYWLYPVFFVSGAFTTTGFDDTGWIQSLSYATWQHAVLLQHVWWPDFGDGTQYPPNLWFIFLPLAAFILPWFSKLGKRFILTLILLALTGIFLVKGINAPLGNIYEWLFTEFPGFSALRDPAKFFYLIAFTYALLIGIGINGFLVSIKKKIKQACCAFVTLFIWMVFCLTMFVGYQDFWLQRVEGNLLRAPLDTTIEDHVNEITTNQNWFRTWWILTPYRYIYFSQSHPNIASNEPKMKAAWSLVPGGEKWWEGFNEADYLELSLKAFGVRYVAVPGDPKKDIYGHYGLATPKDYVEKLKSTGLFSETTTLVDKKGETTTFLKYDSAFDQVFTTQKVVASNDVNDPISLAFTCTDPSQIAIAPLTDDLPVVAKRNAWAAADHIVLKPAHILNEVKKGLVTWQINVPVTGPYQLSIPAQIPKSTLYIGEKAATDVTSRVVANRQFMITETELIAGNNEIKLDLTTSKDGLTDLRNQTNKNQQIILSKKEAEGLVIAYIETALDDHRMILKANYQHQGTTEITLKDGEQYIALQAPADFEQLVLEVRNEKNEHALDDLITFAFIPISVDANNLASLIVEPSVSKTATNKEVTYEHLNESTYNITISDTKTDTILTLSRQFEPGWALYNKQDDLLIDTHFKGNVALNSWYIPANSATEYVLRYQPAQKIKVASYISLVTWLVLLVLIFTGGKLTSYNKHSAKQK